MRNGIQIPAKYVRAILKTTFPNYRLRTAHIVASKTVTFVNLNWSDGTRSEYMACTLDGKPAGLGSQAAGWHDSAPWNNKREGASVEIPRGFCVVQAGYCCGQEARASIYVHPDDTLRLIPSEFVRMTRDFLPEDWAKAAMRD